jgi:hypothetical protein
MLPSRFGRLVWIKERSVEHAGHRIRVVANSDRARLYVDKELLDVTNDLYASEDEATPVGVYGKESGGRACDSWRIR